MTFVRGIEITSVHCGKDVRVLAYFLSQSAPAPSGSACERTFRTAAPTGRGRDSRRLTRGHSVLSANSRISAARVPVWPIVPAIGL